MNYNELSKRIHEITVKRGDVNYSQDHYLMRVIVEVSNAVQAYDKNFRVKENIIAICKAGNTVETLGGCIFGTVEDCFVNIVIRLLELADKEGIPFDYKADYKESLVHLSFTEVAYRFVTTCLTHYWVYPNLCLADALRYMENWAEHLGIDLEFFVNAEIAYYEMLNGVSIDEDIVKAVDEHFHEML